MNSPFRERYEISPIKLQSLLRSRLAASGQARGTPEQWIGTIRNLKKKGVSEVEIKWSDVIPVLEAEKRQSIQLSELPLFDNSLPTSFLDIFTKC